MEPSLIICKLVEIAFLIVIYTYQVNVAYFANPDTIKVLMENPVSKVVYLLTKTRKVVRTRKAHVQMNKKVLQLVQIVFLFYHMKPLLKNV